MQLQRFFFLLFLLFNECAESKIIFVQVRFGNYFKRGVHGNYGNTDVDGVDVHICDIFRNRTAAANVHFAHFARLPNYAVIVKELTEITNVFRVCVVRAALTPCSREFRNACAVRKAEFNFSQTSG